VQNRLKECDALQDTTERIYLISSLKRIQWQPNKRPPRVNITKSQLCTEHYCKAPTIEGSLDVDRGSAQWIHCCKESN